jgi:hypothetical protein
VPYVTSVGGSGLGILSPYGQHREESAGKRPITPPETPIVSGKTEALDEVPPNPLRASFESQSVPELAQWAEARGRWLYV